MPRYSGRIFRKALLVLSAAFCLSVWLSAALAQAFVPELAAARAGQARHALAMHGDPKYPPDFTNLDYINPDAPKGGVLRLAKTGSFDTLNHHIIMGTAAEGLAMTSDQLMQRVWDEPFTLYGLVAESAEIPEDRSWVVYRLRPEARFHDGTPMTAQDVKFSYETYLKHGHPVRRRVYALVSNVTIIDDKTIRFDFGAGYDPETVMILSLMNVLPKHYWQKQDITKTTLTPPLGSGPYKIASVDPGRRIVYERVKDYWAKDLPVNRGHYNFDTIAYTYFRDDDIALQSFKAGEYDIRREYDMAKWNTAYDFRGLSDGRVVKEEIPHGRPEWLRALVFNTRRPVFADIRVREALDQMFNHEWLNTTLYGGKMRRIESVFANSELAARDKPVGEELAVLEQYKDKLSPRVFGEAYKSPSGHMRDRQRRALTLLRDAGWTYKDQRLVNAEGRPMQFEILGGSKADEKIALEFARTLRRIGIDVTVRTVDSAQFAGRLDSFDYDMVAYRWINSLSPGNEQMNYWGSQAAQQKGSRNYAGVNDVVVDALADSIARTRERAQLVTRSRALDRVLMQGYYMIPLFYTGTDMLARNSEVKRPEITPVYGVVLESWWRETVPKTVP